MEITNKAWLLPAGFTVVVFVLACLYAREEGKSLGDYGIPLGGFIAWSLAAISALMGWLLYFIID